MFIYFYLDHVPRRQGPQHIKEISTKVEIIIPTLPFTAMKKLLFVILLIPSLGFGQKANSELEFEIKSLKNKSEIENYWTSIHKDDQSVRGKVSDEQRQMDRQNIKKMVLMFKYHGYPSGFCYGCNPKSEFTNNFTPNIVITHNLVNEVSEFMLPILNKAYNDGIANEWWYIHNLRGMLRARYGRDLYEKTKENIPQYLEKLKPFVKDSISYDLSIIDSLYENYDRNLNSILISDRIFSKKQGGIRHNIYKTKEGKLFWQQVYSDDSFHFPIEIYYEPKSNQLRYGLFDDVVINEILVNNIPKITSEN
ncbi:hypothetical protein A8938_2335 [Algoriphagus zhangzhouensis]|uniref:Uncharacterized protein n=2 Tax=Algoriphagus zhangzhouensis TaxID=1073327 RepID=A0A1M7ZD70_9BACT|nr:hypothetical protein A8938_2335 [Algoriphagus zhangzhouensis]SHO62814.1 hypothetical protein SAMN04488108_2332 [Algoriphagus zhangzhouensis]